MNSDREVVITGIGVVSPIGVGSDDFWNGLITGQSGACIRPDLAETDFPIKLISPVKDFSPKQYIKPRKSIKIMCEPIQFACAAAAMAAEQANLLDGKTDPNRLGTVFGTETFYSDPREVADVFRHCMTEQGYQHEKWGEFAMRKIQPLWMLKYLPNMAASHVSISMDARGHSNSICQGEASGLIALIEAATVIQRGTCDAVIAGGAGSAMQLSSVLYRSRPFISSRWQSPAQASRPFEKNRDGMVAGEGAGAIVMESAEHAARRGAQPLARLNGWSRRFQNPDSANVQSGISDSFDEALRSAQMEAGDIGWINADACGSVERDPLEAQAIANRFGTTLVVAHKSNFGNLGPGTSNVELIASILSLQNDCIPGTLNYDEPDPACPVAVSRDAVSLSGLKPTVLKSSLSATGQMAAVILSRI